MPKLKKPGRLMLRGAMLLGFVAAAFPLGGCTPLAEYIHNGFEVGPNYHRPPTPLPGGWIDDADPKVRHGDPNLCTWWDVFDDPILNKLIRDSYGGNLTIRAAAYQILQAEELRCIAAGELLPQAQSFVLGYTRNMASLTGGAAGTPTATFGTALTPIAALTPVAAPSTPIAGLVDPGTGATTSTTTSAATSAAASGVGFGGGRYFSNIATTLNASWELDFWGLFRRNLESANAILDQSIDNMDEMVVLLLANVATAYVEIRTFQRRIELARSNVAMQEPLVEVYRKRWKSGIINAEPGYLQLLANLENTRALIPFLEISLRQSNNSLCVLLGQPVHDLLPILGDGTVPDPNAKDKRRVHIPQPRDESVVVGIPGDYLLRRPDVLSAEAALRSQSAQIGIAQAEMLPHIGINGTIGLASAHLNHLFDSRSWTGSIGPSLSWNILNYGRLLANVRLQSFAYQQFVLQYQQAILNANLDAENAMIAYLRSIDQADHLQKSADAAAGSVAYLERQMKLGYLPSIPATGADVTGAFVNQLFTLINFQVTQQDAAAQAQGNIALNLILLYRAMGGGWQIRLENGGQFCANLGDGSLPPWAWNYQGQSIFPGRNLDGTPQTRPAPSDSSKPAPKSPPEDVLPPPKLLPPLTPKSPVPGQAAKDAQMLPPPSIEQSGPLFPTNSP